MSKEQIKKATVIPNGEVEIMQIVINNNNNSSSSTKDSGLKPRKLSAPLITFDDETRLLCERLSSCKLSSQQPQQIHTIPKPAVKHYNIKQQQQQQRRRASVDERNMIQANGVSIPRSRSTAATNRSTAGSVTEPSGGGQYFSVDKRVTLYKTEMCRTYEETGICKYGTKCQFAHDRSELRSIQRHPRYKTEICKTFWEQGQCPYGKRCCFIHTEEELRESRDVDAKAGHVDEHEVNEDQVNEDALAITSKLLSKISKVDIFSTSLPVTTTTASFPLKSSLKNNSNNFQLGHFLEEASFLDTISSKPVGSPPFTYNSHALIPRSSPHRLHVMESFFESLSMHSGHSGSDDAWEEDSIGLIPADLIQS